MFDAAAAAAAAAESVRAAPFAILIRLGESTSGARSSIVRRPTTDRSAAPSRLRPAKTAEQLRHGFMENCYEKRYEPGDSPIRCECCDVSPAVKNSPSRWRRFPILQPSARHQPQLQGRGHGVDESNGRPMPVYLPAYAGTKLSCLVTKTNVLTERLTHSNTEYL